MKYLLALFSVLTLGLSATYAQIYDPVSWETRVEKSEDNTYYLITTASIDSGWHIYSQVVKESESGIAPLPTEFSYSLTGEQKLVGKTQEGKGHEAFDAVFEMEIKYFENQAKSIQHGLKVLSKSLEELIMLDPNQWHSIQPVWTSEY